MDLESLRKKALSTKRNRATIEDSDITLEDLEEGEIILGTSTAPVVPSPHQDFQPTSSTISNVAHPPTQQIWNRQDTSHHEPYDHVNPAHFEIDLKEELTAIISELVQYGVTADYLLLRGCSKDTINASCRELNLPCPDASEHADPSDMDMDMDIDVEDDSSSVDTEGVSASAPLREDLEAQKREQLLARKAMTAARNQETAMSLVEELDQLISAHITTEVAPLRNGSATRPHSPDETSSAVAHPQSATLVRPPHAPLDEYPRTAAPYGIGFSGRGRIARSRPRAIDFEGFSWDRRHHDGSSTRQTHRALSYLPVMPARLVIDLSDDEEDQHNVTVCDTQASEPRRPTLTAASPDEASTIEAATTPSLFAPAPPEGSQADSAQTSPRPSRRNSVISPAPAPKAQLHQKEEEIRRIMARIAELERKKSKPPSKQLDKVE